MPSQKKKDMIFNVIEEEASHIYMCMLTYICLYISTHTHTYVYLEFGFLSLCKSHSLTLSFITCFYFRFFLFQVYM